MKDLAARLREVFRVEAEADLSTLASQFAAWEKQLPSPPPAAIEEVFRTAHKIKGACRAVSFSEGQTLGHLLEYLFRAWHEAPKEISASAAADARRCFEAFTNAVRSYLAGEPTVLPVDLVETINGHLRACGSSHTVSLPANPAYAAPPPSPSAPPATPPHASTPAAPAAPAASVGSAPRPINPKILASFRGEAAELIEILHRHLDSSADGLSPEAVNSALRAAHTLKGAAGVVRFSRTSSLAHELEDLFRSLEKSGTSAENASATAAVLSKARRLLGEIEESLAGEDAAAASSQSAPVEKRGAESSDSRKTSAAAGEKESAEARAPSPVAEIGSLRVETARVKRLEDAFADLMMLSPQLDELLETSAELSADVAALAREEETLRHGLGAFLYRAPENQEYARAASYINFASRQLRALQRSILRLESRLRRSLALLDQRLSGLDRELHSLQLTPAHDVLSGLDAMVRELGNELGKPAVLITSGFHLEMERSSLQKLRAALVHLLRNSLDHGIESAAERSSMGKPSEARICVALSLQGGQYEITVEDDGRGLVTREIRRRAIAQNFLSAEKAATLSEAEIHRLIFHPRFTTVEKTSQLSGRGMGLSSVEETLRSLGGSVSVSSTAGKGTCFTLRFPARRAGDHLLLVEAAGELFGIPANFVERVQQAPRAELPAGTENPHWPSPSGPIPLRQLSSLLSLPDSSSPGKHVCVLILRSDSQKHALLVDSVLALRKVVVRDLPPAAAASRIFGGCIPLAEGRSALLLEVSELLRSSQPGSFAIRSQESSEAPEKSAPSEPVILVVDDSYTSRTLEAGVIESMGFRVLQAADGLDGLRILRNESVDLILCDIEMPRMDGFSMLAEVKKNERMRDIPFILISSLEDPAIVQKGLNLGADSYIVKRHFEQEQLRDLIHHYL